MKILLFGAGGQLGMDIQRVFNPHHDVIAVDQSDCDIRNFADVEKLLMRHKPDAVINSAGMTDVPACETQDQDAFAVNALGAKNIAKACFSVRSKLLHISTDYVFDGQKKSPYIETDIPNPVNTYGISKLTGEFYIKAYHDQYWIVRSSGLYGIHPCLGKKSNFVETMLKLSREKSELNVVDDEILTPTFTLDLARQLEVLMSTNRYGVYHITNNGSCSWHTFATKIFELSGINIPVHKTSAAAFASPVKRPPYSVLENHALKILGLDRMKSWDEALAEYFIDRKNINN